MGPLAEYGRRNTAGVPRLRYTLTATFYCAVVLLRRCRVASDPSVREGCA